MPIATPVPQRAFYRVTLGKANAFAELCFRGGFVGFDFEVAEDLSAQLTDTWKAFNKAFVPRVLEARPDKSRIYAGLSSGTAWTIARGIRVGDYVLSPNGTGGFRFGEVTGEYYYSAAGPLPHRRPVRWTDRIVERDDMGSALQNSLRYFIGTVSDLSAYGAELAALVEGPSHAELVTESASAFVFEKHLEDFLVENWQQTALGRQFEIYQDEDQTGRQFPADTGRIDILAVSKDRKTLLVVELKRGRASDDVVGQTLRYMGYVKQEMAEDGQDVRGLIIALEEDPKLRRALAMVPSVSFYRYEMTFKLVEAHSG